jgi:two-component system, NtrC family, sensor histidine kinase HydH
MLYRRLRLLEHERERNLRLAQLGQAARTLAHEIRNPLAAAQMQSALLRRTSPDSDTRRFDVIDEELGRIKQLTEQVRTYLQSSPGSPESIDLAQLVHEIAERSGYAAAIATSGQPVVRFDLERLRSVCANVIRNAAESTDPAGSVDVTIRERRDVVEMVVADRGPGIPPESRDRVFDPFYTTKDHGSGVGLAITRRYIEEMKGTISIRDRRGGGTEIVITFRKGDDARSGR